MNDAIKTNRTAPKLTEAQRAALVLVRDGGRFAVWAVTKDVWQSVVDAGLGTVGGTLTDAGRAALRGVMTAPVSMTVDQAREAIARIQRHVSYSPEDGMLSAEQDLFAACNTLISQAQALSLLNSHIDTLERELTELGNMHRAACDELEEAKAVLRGLYP